MLKCNVMIQDTQGCMPMATCEGKKEQARVINLNARRITIRGIASTLNISGGSAHSIVHDIRGFHKDCAWWVLTELTEEHKHSRVGIGSVCWSSTAV
jgi:hypothetical protein